MFRTRSGPANSCWSFIIPDFSLVPVDHQPDFSDVSLIPVDHDPFSADDMIQQARAQLESQPQRLATGAGLPNVGAPAIDAQAAASGESYDPDSDSASGVPRPDRPTNPSAAPMLSPDKSTVDWSRLNQPFGELKPATYTPTQRVGNFAADALMSLGMQPYTANDLTSRVGNVLGLSPLGVFGSALDLIDAKRRDDLPGVAMAAAGMIPGAKGIARGAAEETGAGLRALTDAAPRSPASRAAEKGYSDISTTLNGGPTLAGSDHLYPAGEGQRSVVKIKLTGSRRADEKLANELGGFTEAPDGYMWHHVDDFDPPTGTSSLELVKDGAHRATYPHSGSVAQYQRFHGKPYKR
jgi:hypothetical protein